jgi:SAM-dependent methyltransferase
MNSDQLKTVIRQYVHEALLPWEEHYLDYHADRYLDTLKILGQGQGEKMLDVGAFPGHLTLAAHHLGFKTQGLTGRAESTPSLQMIIDRLDRLGIPTALADVESEPFPFPDNTFDVVLASEIIEHLHYNPYRLLRESFRVLKPGGRILISTPNINRLENIVRMIRGRTIHSEISGRFDESFSSIFSARHVREYSASDLAYMLEGQNKEMYQFEKVSVHYSKCLDPAFSKSFPVKWIDRFWPRFRSTLMVEARRPQATTLIPARELGNLSGVYDVEEHSADMKGIARMLTVPYRWTEGTAHLHLPASEASYQIFYFNLVWLVPERLSPSWWTFSIKGQPVSHFCLAPDRMFTKVRVVLTVEMAEQGFFPLVLSGPVWKPSDHPVANDYEFSTDDTRSLGVIVGWDGFLREDCPGKKDLDEAALRESRSMEKYEGFDPNINWRRLHHCFDDRWSHLQALYLRQADFKPVLRMGKKDWRQLGPGWYFLENWGVGPVRWSSRRAEAYLSAGPGNRQVYIKAYGGDPFLGERVSGILKLEFSPDRFSFVPLGETPFEISAGAWANLQADFNQSLFSSGLIRLQILVDQSRIPAERIPGSADTRDLGLAVAGIAVR